MSTLVQRGSWPGWVNADIYGDDTAGVAYLSGAQACAREGGGVSVIAEPVGGLRTVDQVKAMRSAFYSRDPGAMRHWNLDPASTAPPVLNSPHITGLCFDIYGTGFTWWVKNGTRFGFRRTLVAQNDLHHFQYFPGTATAPLTVGLASIDSHPLADQLPTYGEHSMEKFTRRSSGRVYGFLTLGGNPALILFGTDSPDGTRRPAASQLTVDGYGAPSLTDPQVLDVLINHGLRNLTRDGGSDGTLGKLDRLAGGLYGSREYLTVTD